MKIIGKHIVEESWGAYYCGEYFYPENEQIKGATTFKGLCTKCARAYKGIRDSSRRFLPLFKENYRLFFNFGEPYILKINGTNRIRIPCPSLDFLQREEYITGWYKGDYVGNREIKCRLLTRGIDYINGKKDI